jgi:hypothetical protein
MVSDGSFLYFADPAAGTIQRIGVTGGSIQPVAQDQAGPDHLVIDETNVYWVNLLGASVMKVAKSGGMPELLAPVNQPAWLAIDDTFAYFTSVGDKTVMRVPKAGGMPSLVANTDLPPHDLVVLGDAVIYQQCSTCADLTCAGRNTFLKVPKTGGTPTVLDPALVQRGNGCLVSLVANDRYFAALSYNNSAFGGGLYDASGKLVLPLGLFPSYMDRDFVYGRDTVFLGVKWRLCTITPSFTYLSYLGNTGLPRNPRLVAAGDDRFLYELFNDSMPPLQGIRRYPR